MLEEAPAQLPIDADTISHGEDVPQAAAQRNVTNGSTSETDPPSEILSSTENNGEPWIPRSRLATLEAKLAEALSTIDRIREEKQQCVADSDEMLVALQTNLQQQMSLKAEAENKARLAERKIQELQEENQLQADQLQKLESVEDSLEHETKEKVDAENTAKLAFDQVQQLETERDAKTSEIKDLHKQLVKERQEKAAQEEELNKIRQERDEQARKEMALTTRLNAAKKNEAVKVNIAESFEEELKEARRELEELKAKYAETVAAKEELDQELQRTQKSMQTKVQKADNALAEEKKLNEERKSKMKAFVEGRSEELRQAKEDNDSLQVELTQTNKSLVELNNRWKQLHTQWVQAQTRNRELQRDLNRIKKDSENLHKVGDTLEMKMAKSKTETEEHKSKRIAAKHELMTVLRTLDAERAVNAQLKDKIKFTFTPKALSQQQMVEESLEDFEAQLAKLAARLGKALPAGVEGDESERSESDHRLTAEDGDGSGEFGGDVAPLVWKLEHETDRVSQGIRALSSKIDRLRMVIDASGERTCYTVLSELLTTGSVRSSPAATQEGSPLRRHGSHEYGQVPSTGDH
jgi:chromosome segregation ATPase